MPTCARPVNRMTSNRVKYSDNGTWKWLKRAHEFSATGAILKSTYKAWNDGAPEPIGNSLHHSWGQDGKHVQNTDTAGVSFGKPWHWAGAQNNHAAPLKNPNADTASQNAYNLPAAGGAGDPQRRTYINPTTAGDQRQFWGQGQPEAKDSVNDWRYGKKSKAAAGVFPEIESRFAYSGTVVSGTSSVADLSRNTDAREKGRVSFFGSGYSYAGSSPRVTSEKIGRDINPLGRGSGRALVGGMLNMGRIAPHLPLTASESGSGSSVNNSCSAGSPCASPVAQPRGSGVTLIVRPWDHGEMNDQKFEDCNRDCRTKCKGKGDDCLIDCYDTCEKEFQARHKNDPKAPKDKGGGGGGRAPGNPTAQNCGDTTDKPLPRKNLKCSFDMPSTHDLCVDCNKTEHGGYTCVDRYGACLLECVLSQGRVPEKCRKLLDKIRDNPDQVTVNELIDCIKEAGGKIDIRKFNNCSGCCTENSGQCEAYATDKFFWWSSDDSDMWDCLEDTNTGGGKVPKTGTMVLTVGAVL